MVDNDGREEISERNKEEGLEKSDQVELRMLNMKSMINVVNTGDGTNVRVI